MTERWKWLQFFAEGAPAGGDAGGEGSAAGVESGIPGRTPEEFGIPSDKAERFRRAQHRGEVDNAGAQEAGPPAAEAAPDAQQSTAAEDTTHESWEDFFARPENKARMQQTIRERLERSSRAQREEQEITDPMIKLLARFYGISPDQSGAYDLRAVAAAVRDDDRMYETYASELGVPNNVGKRMLQLEERVAQNDAAREQEERDEELRSYFYGIAQQAEKMKEIYPEFDLQREMADPRFYDMIDPDKPEEKRLSVKEAFWALHGEQIAEKQAEAIARQLKAQLSSSIQAGQGRPRENGGSTAPAMQSIPDLKNMTKDQRRAWAMARCPPLS